MSKTNKKLDKVSENKLKKTKHNDFIYLVLRGHVFDQASTQHGHVVVSDVSLDLELTAVAPELLIVLGAIIFFYLGLFKCPTSFFNLEEKQGKSTLSGSTHNNSHRPLKRSHIVVFCI